MITIGIADDHQLFLKSLALMLVSFDGVTVIAEAPNGKELQQKLAALPIPPDIILLDVNMPVMNGEETAAWLGEQYPAVKVIALSMNDDDKTIIKMIKAGCCAYLLKDSTPDELERAIRQVHIKGYYNADAANINFRRLLQTQSKEEALKITEKERQFLQLACSDLTYKQIAAQMNLSERTIDGYRESLFGKLNVQSRVGLALEAIRKELVQL
jgi:DNA-binding NarL/FixJ family response regulator